MEAEPESVDDIAEEMGGDVELNSEEIEDGNENHETRQEDDSQDEGIEEHGPQPEVDSQDEDDSDVEPPVKREERIVDTFIRVKKRISKNEKLHKESVMPTWQGAQHLIQKYRAAITNKEPWSRPIVKR